ncbi:MAG: hypothetical protein AUG74_03225 [Bacteroidetes bacterium 13_1_20CM_4_60_6]|nr:MAG: hypothetical protein AUG74_03225 [Bacteroidetes bacterium 13_1_20CM_4_60_6]
MRIEIEAALRREIPIIPVLTRGASHPTKAMLPASLEALAYRHGTSIRHEHFRWDVDSLISQMDKLLERQESTPSKSAESKEPQETEADATSGAAPVSVGETTPQFPTRSAPPELDSGRERSQQDSVASAKDPTTQVKSTQTTESQPPISPVASISAIAASKKPAVWRRRGLIIVTAVGATVMLLVTITVLLTRPHPSVRKAPELYQKGADQGKAADLYQKAADQGYADAQNNLGWLYEHGVGVPKDLGKAAELYQKAADQGYAGAQNNLGWLYANGQGVTKDFGKAAELFRKAADQGNARAQNNLGWLYEYGDGVPMNLGKAEQLYQKAANQGDRSAIANLKRLSGH